MEEFKPTRYAVIVHGPNSTRAYIVHVPMGVDPIKKLADKVNLIGVEAIHVAEILLDTDEF